MIRNSTELQLVREQVLRLENTLAKLRAEVESKSPRRFRLIAESYIDSLTELRGQIDEYVGVETTGLTTAPLVLTLRGDGIRLGESKGSLVTRTFENLRKGIAGVLDAMSGQGDLRGGGRHLKWIERVTDLPFVLAPGSVRIVLGEPSTSEMFEASQLADLDRALELIVAGAAWVDEGTDAPFNLQGVDDHVRQAILLTLSRLAPGQSSEVDELSIGGRLLRDREPATLTRESRGRIQTELRRPMLTAEYVELRGTIREVDLDKREFRLRELGNVAFETECAFDEWVQSEVTTFLDIGEPVIVSGVLRTGKGRGRRLDVELIGPLDATLGEDQAADSTP